MNYEQIKSEVFAMVRVNDGYFGDTLDVGLSLRGTTVVCVADFGLYRSGLPDMSSASEVVYYLTNHPLKYPHMKLISIKKEGI